MKVNSKQLLVAIKSIISVVPSKVRNDYQQILTTTRLQTSNNNLMLSGTNLDQSLEVQVPAIGTDDILDVCVNPRDLIKALGKPKANEETRLSIEGDKLLVQTASMQIVLETMDSKDFPIVPLGCEHGVDFKFNLQLPTADWIDLLYKTSFACADYDWTSILGGMYLVLGDNLQACATDASRLVESTLDYKANEPWKGIIPYDACKQMLDIFKTTSTINISTSDKFILVSTDTIKHYSRLTPGEYPRYADLFPNKSRESYSVDGNAMLQSLKALKPLVDKRLNTVTLVFDNGIVNLHTDISQPANMSLPATFTKPNTVCLNIHYLIDVFERANKTVTMDMDGALKPCILNYAGNRHLVMPVQSKQR